jgi:BMFP domain-containing protein YqiC
VVNKSKILSDLSKMAVDAMSTFSSMRKEVETLISLRTNKVINKMNLVKRDEFEALKKLVQKISLENQKLNIRPTKKNNTKSKVKKKYLQRKSPKK